VKVVEGSEIYNFPIYHFEHFYSKFLRKSRSNVASSTRLSRAPLRHVRAGPRPRAPEDTPSQAAPSPGPCACRGRLVLRVTVPAQRPAVRRVSSGREPAEAPPSVRLSLGSSRVAYKATAAPCLGVQDPLATGRAVRRRQAGLPRRARIPSAACPAAVPSTLSRACCCSPARSLLPPSRRLAGAGLPAAAARLCRGVPLPAQPRLQPSPQTGRRRVPSHPP
jgi:hypothetical protein